jgi:hypothetical protein
MESLLCSPLVGKFVCAASFSGSVGVIHRAQALAAGMSPGAIQSRLESGEFVRILPRVYRDSSTPLTYQQRSMAAISLGWSAIVRLASSRRETVEGG